MPPLQTTSCVWPFTVPGMKPVGISARATNAMHASAAKHSRIGLRSNLARFRLIRSHSAAHKLDLASGVNTVAPVPIPEPAPLRLHYYHNAPYWRNPDATSRRNFVAFLCALRTGFPTFSAYLMLLVLVALGLAVAAYTAHYLG